MREPIRAARLFVPLLLFALVGCFRLSRDTPALEQYALGGATAMDTAAATDSTSLTIGVRRLDLAPYLAVPAIVVRRGAHRIVVSEYHRWAEDPVEGINRAVARAVARGANVRAALVAPWPLRTDFDYIVQLHVSRFEGLAPEDSTAVDGEAQLLATWEIIRPLDDAVLARGATDYRERGWSPGDYPGLVTLLDRGLEGLAREIVACLGRLAAATAGAGDVEPIPYSAPALACAPRPERPHP